MNTFCASLSGLSILLVLCASAQATDAGPVEDGGEDGEDGEDGTRFWGFSAEGAQGSGPPAPYGFAVWTEPIGSVLLGAAGFGYLSFGAQLALQKGVDLVLEGAGTFGGNWYGCGTRSTGVFAALGVAFRFGDRPDWGWFLQPKLRVRAFSTTGGSESSMFADCSPDNLAMLRGSDREIGMGLDLGYQMRFGPLFLAPLLGVSFGVCLDAPGGNFFHADFDLFTEIKPRERVSACGGLNLNLLRIGVAF